MDPAGPRSSARGSSGRSDRALRRSRRRPPVLDGLRGFSIDVLTMLRWRAFGNAYPPASSPAVVVALDEETFRTPPFEGSPSVTWTPEIGRVLTAIIDGGAKVVGFDIVFPTSIEQSAMPFGDETLGAHLRGFDRDFLRSLALGARTGKVVLGEMLGGDAAVSPSHGQRVAVRQQQNIRPLNVYFDPDDIVDAAAQLCRQRERECRRWRSSWRRARIGRPSIDEGGRVSLSGYRVPGRAEHDDAELRRRRRHSDFFAGGLACRRGDDKLSAWFAGKVVIFGSVLDIEDRRQTSKRFATGIEGARAALRRRRRSRRAISAAAPSPASISMRPRSTI